MQKLFSVVTTGRKNIGFSQREIASLLSGFGGLTSAQVDAALKGMPTILQQGVEKTVADSVAEALTAVGIKCHVVESLNRIEGEHGLKQAQEKAKSSPRVMQLPSVENPGAEVRHSSYSREDILKGFRPAIEPVRTGNNDRLRMLLSAVLMLIFPLAYLATLFGIGAAVVNVAKDFLFASNNDPLTMYGAGGVVIVATLSFIALVYRSLGDWRRDKKFVALDRDRQPQLYALVDKLAETIGVQPPSVIKLDAEVGTVLKPQEFAGVGGKRTELIIGLPVIYSMNVRQLSGVIAHAFSSFDKDAVDCGYPLITSVNAWLYRAALEARTSHLRQFSYRKNSKRFFLLLPSYIMLPFDKLAQIYFSLLHRMASGLSFSVSRKMDMLADQYSSQVSGSGEFRATQFRLRALQYGQQRAYEQMLENWKEGKLAKNYPSLVADYASSLRIELKPKLIREMEELVTPMTRSRVVDLGRIVNVEKNQHEGACFILGAAVELINDLEKISAKVTEYHYVVSGIADSANYSELVSDYDESPLPASSNKAAETFLGWQISKRYIRVDGTTDHDQLTTDARKQDLQDVVHKLTAIQFKIKSMAIRYCQLEERVDRLHVAKTLKEAGIDTGNDVDVSRVSGLREIETVWLRTLNEQGALKGDLTYYEALLSRRIALALSLAKESESIENKAGVDSLSDWIEMAADALTFLDKSYESIVRLRTYSHTLGELINSGQGLQLERVKPFMDRYYNYCRVEMDSIMGFLGAVAYPLELPKHLEIKREFPSISNVMHAQIPGIENSNLSVAHCYRVSHSVLAFLDKFSADLYLALDNIVRLTENQFSVTPVEQHDDQSFKRGSWLR